MITGLRKSNMEPYNVLHLITLSNFAGAQRVVYNIAKYLDRKKYEVTVVCSDSVGELSCEDSLIDKLKDINIRVEIIREMVREINIKKDLLAVAELYHVFKRNKFHIVHLHGTKAGLLGRLAAKMASIPIIIYTVHGFVFLEPMSKLKSDLYKLLEKLFVPFCDVIITVSENDRKIGISEKIAKKNKIVTIHNGIEIVGFTGVFQKKEFVHDLSLNSATSIIGIVANFLPTKGHQYLLQAIPNIIKKFPKAVFLLIGTGPLKAEMEELCQDLNIIEHVRFTGYRTDVPKLLQLMDILVIPSVKEGFPFVLLEGAYASRPIVATQVGGVSELIDNGVSGILVPPKDSLALSEAIVYLLENPELARSLGQMAQKKVMSNFSVETMAKQTELLYDRLIARKLVNQR